MEKLEMYILVNRVIV